MLFTASIFLFKNNILSQNLIQNGNFENYTEDVGTSHCVTNFSSMFNWQQIFSPDIFVKSCTFVNHYGVPSNTFGFSYPKNGNAYIGLGLLNLPYETKEYIVQHLTNPLVAGKSYYTSFYVSKADRTIYSTKNIGAYFSISQPTVVPGDNYVQAIPQVENHSGFLTDTVGWTKIEGYFIAQGGEQYITIGNFNSNANTDTINSGTTNPIPYDNGTAYYYLDSVSLYDSLDYITNVKNHENDFKVNLYPNPNNGDMRIDYKLGSYARAEFKLFDVTGKLVSKYNILSNEGSLLINEQNLNNGIYFYHILVGEKTLKTDKIVIIK